MDRIDSFLTSLGFPELNKPIKRTLVVEEPVTQEESVPIEEPEEDVQEETSEQPQEEISGIHQLSDTDFSEVLQDIGFAASNTESNDETGDLSSAEEFPNMPEPVVSIEEIPVEQQPEPEDNPYALPENSPTLSLDTTTSRFSGTEWFNEIQKTSVILAGLGGIGSNVAFQLSRMGIDNLYLYDGDVVEDVNMSGQLYSRDDIGQFKADAITNMLQKYTSTKNIYAISSNFDNTCTPADIMMCGFDSMAARKMFFNHWKNHIVKKAKEERTKCFFCDGRLSIDTLQVLSIRGDDAYNIERYEREYLFTDEEADVTVCSMKQTTYLACMIGAFMVNMFTNFVASTLNPIIPYDIPFFIEYSARNVLFKSVM